MLTRLVGLVVAVFVGALVGAPAWAAPGNLDLSFGVGGHVRVQANARCLAVCVEFGGSYAQAVALQRDGDIVLGGYNNYIGAPAPRPGEVPGALVGLSSNGALDTSFGVGGIEDTPFGAEQIDANAIGGLAVLGSGEGGIGLARYTAMGTLDEAFAPQGVRWMPQPVGLQEAQRDTHGRVVVLVAVARTHIDVVRYLESGALDSSFGHRGHVRLPLPETRQEAALPPALYVAPEATPTAFAIPRDGSVIVAFAMASSTSTGFGPQRYFLERLMPSGRVDRAFGRLGIVRMTEKVSKMAVAPDGHILLASVEGVRRRQGHEQLGRPNGSSLEGGDLVLADYTSAGRPDGSFGNDGIARSRLLDGMATGIDPRDIAFDGAGDAVVVGELPKRTTDVPSGTGFLARYTRYGLDCSFGSQGVVVDDEIGGASAVTVQPNSRIVIAGWSGNAFMAARYMGGGTPRTCS